ncbi:MAG: hypothetical protein QXF12_05040 [Candidatus Aenigmatarchaeota archaeon]
MIFGPIKTETDIINALLSNDPTQLIRPLHAVKSFYITLVAKDTNFLTTNIQLYTIHRRKINKINKSIENDYVAIQLKRIDNIRTNMTNYLMIPMESFVDNITIKNEDNNNIIEEYYTKIELVRREYKSNEEIYAFKVYNQNLEPENVCVVMEVHNTTSEFYVIQEQLNNIYNISPFDFINKSALVLSYEMPIHMITTDNYVEENIIV